MRDVDWEGLSALPGADVAVTEDGFTRVDLGRGLTLPNPVGLASGTAGTVSSSTS